MDRQPHGLEDIEGSIGFSEDPTDKIQQPPIVEAHQAVQAIGVPLPHKQDCQSLVGLS